MERVEHMGGCHCGAVRFSVMAPTSIVAWECNCSMCNMQRNTHFIVPAADFKLLTDESAITTYTFGTHVAKWKFCSRCGVVSFYSPRSNPDGVAVTVHCITSETIKHVEIRQFDGQNWEQAWDDTGIQKFSKSEKVSKKQSTSTQKTPEPKAKHATAATAVRRLNLTSTST